MKKLNFNKKTWILVSTMILVVVLLSSFSFALFRVTIVGTKDSIVKTGLIDLELDEMKCTPIQLLDAFPMTDEEGMQLSSCTFTITNKSTIPLNYEIYLDDDVVNPGETRINDKYIKYNLQKETESVGTDLVSNKGANPNRMLYKNSFNPGNSITFTLRLWVDYDADEEAMNKTFSGKIRVDAEQGSSNTLVTAESSTTSTTNFLNGPYKRNEITYLSFKNTLDCTTAGTLNSTLDVSTEQKGGIIAKFYDVDETNKSVLICSNGAVNANPDSYSWFGSLTNLKSLDLSNFDTSQVTNMRRMFYRTGQNSQVFTLDLGHSFDTSQVTNMQDMFQQTGQNSQVFTLDLGDKFNTSQVKWMNGMFYNTGQKSLEFTLNLGDNFDTSQVLSMSEMFAYAGQNSPGFTLNLGDSFDTSKVEDMSSMFMFAGNKSLVLTLDLGDKFDTSQVKDMAAMFYNTGQDSQVFTLDLGQKFNTRQVTRMSQMFYFTGSNSSVFTLKLGDKFDTSQVKNMGSMFSSTGRSSQLFTLDLGDKFDTSKVTNMSSMFSSVGISNPTFTLTLGDKFDTSQVTEMKNMFSLTGNSNPNFYIDARNANFIINPTTVTTEMFRYSKATDKFYTNSSTTISSIQAITTANAKWNGEIINCSVVTCPTF